MENLKDFEFLSLGVSKSCPVCQDNYDIGEDSDPDEEICDEGGFSKHSCEWCGSYLAGMRYSAHAIHKESGEVFHFEICECCVEVFS